MKMSLLAVRSLMAIPVALVSHALFAGAPDEPGPTSTKTGPVLTTEWVVSGNAKLKAGGEEFQYVTFLQSAFGVSQTVPTGEAAGLTFGLIHSLSLHTVAEPKVWVPKEWKEFKRDHPNWERVPLPARLQSLSLSVEYSRQLDDLWSFSSCLAAGSHVAGTGLLSDGWGVSASVMAQHKWSPSFTVAFGAAFDSLSHDYRLVPLVGFEWQISEKWSASLGFPATAITYQLNQQLSFSIEATGSGGTYRVRDEPAPGVAPRPLKGSKLETTEVRAGVGVNWRISDTVSLRASHGIVMYRLYKYIDRDFKVRSHDMEDFVAVSATLSF